MADTEPKLRVRLVREWAGMRAWTEFDTSPHVARLLVRQGAAVIVDQPLRHTAPRHRADYEAL